jgi:cysteine sulfinate desulfinase/cysteine desulfurase-like protein
LRSTLRLLNHLDLAGIAASAVGVHVRDHRTLHVLLAIGRNRATASASLRLSLGSGTTSEAVDYAADEIIGIVRRIGKPARNS